MTDNKNYKVGYASPPEHTRFKKGQSGNPKGKPRKNTTFEEEVQNVLATRVPVTMNGKKTYVSKRQLLIEQIINGAINKNPAMMRLALPLLKMSDGAPDFEVLPADEKALRDLLGNLDSQGDKYGQS